MKKACIFDLDGTLANTIESIAYFGNHALSALGYQTIDVGTYRYLVGNGADRLMRGMLSTVAPGYGEDAVAELRKLYDGFYESNPMYLVKNYPGVPETVKKLKESGILTAVLSNKPDNVTQMVVRELFPDGTFDRCHGQRDGVARKPSPEGALLVAEELGVKPEECLYIGDSDVDMKTGKAAGMETVGVLWGFRDREELEANEAQHVIAQPEELLELAMGKK